MALTVQDALDHLHIDYPDAVIQKNVERALNTAIALMKGAVGADVEVYLPGDPRIDDLVLLRTAEVYDERSSQGKQGAAKSRLADLLETQLRLELRRAKEEAGVQG